MTSEALTTVYDHYKDTCSIIGAASKRRDRLMALTFAVLIFFSLEFIFPAPVGVALNALIEKQYGLKEAIDVGFIGNVVWLTLLITSVRYFQTAAYVERQYPYLHQLEDRVNEALGHEWISREGKSYLKNYPPFHKWLSFLYQTALPVLLFVIPSIRIAIECRDVGKTMAWPPLTFYPDLAIYVLFVISTLLYVQMIHVRKANERAATSEDSPTAEP
jgi:hypothetical protein